MREIVKRCEVAAIGNMIAKKGIDGDVMATEGRGEGRFYSRGFRR